MLTAAGAALLAAGAACGGAGANQTSDYTVVRRLPHDTGAYTQGLLLHGGRLYESVGQYGRSDIRRVELASGRVLARVPLATDRFGEGLTLLGNRLYQLTWKEGVGYVYDAVTLARVDSFAYQGEGWGLATDGTSLILSDGTARLRFLDPRTFRVAREVTVLDRGSPLLQINELEYIRGELFANVYQSDWIVRIDPVTGTVRSWLDLEGLLPEARRTTSTEVLNGIAYDPATGHLLVTGKHWPELIELRLRQAPGDTTAPRR